MKFFDVLHSKNIFPWNFLRFLLYFPSKCYEIIIIFRNKAFDTGILKITKVNVPVISLGNITTGGTGKTPAVIWLCRNLSKICSRIPVILSRGYGNDESHMLSYYLPEVPHYTNPRRVIGAKQAVLEYSSNICLVLDDAFQHRYLHRDVDIVLLDATQPFGFSHVLPLGLLREPIQSIRRASVIVITRSNQIPQQQLTLLQEQISQITTVPQFLAQHKATQIRSVETGAVFPLNVLSQHRWLPVCGIGNPQSFIQTLRELCIAKDISPQIYPDHYPYSPKDCENIQQQCVTYGCSGVITTSKDAVKMQRYFSTEKIWVLDIEFCILEENKFLSFLSDTLFKV